MNICYNALDRHVNDGRGDENALLYDSVYTGEKTKFAFREAQKATA